MMSPGIGPGQNPPFHELGEYVFQDLCRDLFDSESSIATCEVYGTRGQLQHGIDLLAHRVDNQGIEVGQCKCYEDFSPADVRKASDEFFAHWNRWSQENVVRFILFVACDLSRRQLQDEIIEQRKRFARFAITYEAWSAAKIRNKLRPHPGIVADYCKPEEYWVRVICGETPLRFVAVDGQVEKTSIAVQTAMLNQLEQLSMRVSGDIEEHLELMRTAWQEGRSSEVLTWVNELKDDPVTWPVLASEIKARVLRFEAGLALEMTGDVDRAKFLADEAQTLVPSDKQAPLRALIAYREIGPEAALELLDECGDIDSRNLRASLLLELGRADECLAILDLEDSESQVYGGN